MGLILNRFHLNVNSHTCLVAAILANVGTDSGISPGSNPSTTTYLCDPKEVFNFAKTLLPNKHKRNDRSASPGGSLGRLTRNNGHKLTEPGTQGAL